MNVAPLEALWRATVTSNWDILAPDKLVGFVLFVLPGVIGVQAWDLLVPSHRRQAPELLLKAVAFGVVNGLLVLPLTQPLLTFSVGLHRTLTVGLLIVLPILEALMLRKALSSPWLQKQGVLHPTPVAWDFFFGKSKSCWVLVHLRSGAKIGGYFGTESFASSFPNPEQIYIEQVWTLNEADRFERPVERTMGAVISMAECELVELFTDEEEPHGDEEDGRLQAGT